ncbi:CLUMA_CG019607, isoform A [Clunio marinus]|uniref:CLUMA_CG019607, isoform A n=1 Tax=Clunio marinus TaxID=568069 RepID=A0A1J1J221_9DIPT|nr:CLUMA_CG019607, isoform A [Clunio marinus]
MLSEATQTSNQKWANYLRLYARLAKEANIFQRFNVDKIFHISAMIVHSDYQRRSIGTKFAQKSFALGASLNYKYCSINCSSIYTQNIAEKFNMELVGDIPMDDIKNEKGERLVFPTPPHTRITTYVKRL